MQDQLRRQYLTASKLGWLPDIHSIAQRRGVSLPLLLAIGSRETNLDPKYLNVPGDHGNGYGLTQADRRSYPDFVASGRWRNAAECFDFTAAKLVRNFREVEQSQGRQVTVRFSSGIARQFTAPHLSNADIWRVVIAGYNCGWRAALYHVSKGNDVDAGTTGKNYSRDVMARAKVFARLIQESSPAARPEASVQPIQPAMPEASTRPATEVTPVQPMAPLPSQVQHAARTAERAKNKYSATAILTAISSASAGLWQAHSQLISYAAGVLTGAALAWLVHIYTEKR
jgi:hypothetical protein